MTQRPETLAEGLYGSFAENIKRTSMTTVKDPEYVTPDPLEKPRPNIEMARRPGSVDQGSVDGKIEESTSDEVTAIHRETADQSTAHPSLTLNSDIKARYEEGLKSEVRKYNDLLADGGRASHNPEELTPLAIYENREAQPEIIRYWLKETHDLYEGIIRLQLERWKQFRGVQDYFRRCYSTPETWEEYNRNAGDLIRRRGLAEFTMSNDRSQQTNLDDWREFQLLEHKEADRLENAVTEAENELKDEKERQEAQAHRPGHYSDKDFQKMIFRSLNPWDYIYAWNQLQKHAPLLRWVDDQVSSMDPESSSRNTDPTKKVRWQLPGEASMAQKTSEIAQSDAGLASQRAPRRSIRLLTRPRKLGSSMPDRGILKNPINISKQLERRWNAKKGNARQRRQHRKDDARGTITTRSGRVSKKPDRFH